MLTVVFGILIALCAAAWFGYELRGVRSYRRCRECGYELSGHAQGASDDDANASNVGGGSLCCPECGYVHRTKKEMSRIKRSRLRVCGSLLVVLVAGGLGLRPMLLPGPFPTLRGTLSDPAFWKPLSNSTLIRAWSVASGWGWEPSIIYAVEEELKGRRFLPAEFDRLTAVLLEVSTNPLDEPADSFAEQMLANPIVDETGHVVSSPEFQFEFVDDEQLYFFRRASHAPTVGALAAAAKQHTKNQEWTIRHLGSMAQADDYALDMLLTLLGESGGRVDEALGLIEEDRLIPRLVELLEKPISFEARSHSLRQLVRIYPSQSDLPPPQALVDILARGDTSEKQIAAKLLTAHTLPSELVESLLKSIVDAECRKSDPQPTALASIALCLLECNPESGRRFIQGALESGGLCSQLTAAFALQGQLDECSDAERSLIAAILAKALSDPSGGFVTMVCERFGNSDAALPELDEALIAKVTESDVDAPGILRRTLRQRISREAYIELAAGLLQRPEASRRETGCIMLREVGPYATAYLPRLETLEKDVDPFVMKAAARARREVSRQPGDRPSAEVALDDLIADASRTSANSTRTIVLAIRGIYGPELALEAATRVASHATQPEFLATLEEPCRVHVTCRALVLDVLMRNQMWSASATLVCRTVLCDEVNDFAEITREVLEEASGEDVSSWSIELARQVSGLKLFGNERLQVFQEQVAQARTRLEESAYAPAK